MLPPPPRSGLRRNGVGRAAGHPEWPTPAIRLASVVGSSHARRRSGGAASEAVRSTPAALSPRRRMSRRADRLRRAVPLTSGRLPPRSCRRRSPRRPARSAARAPCHGATCLLPQGNRVTGGRVRSAPRSEPPYDAERRDGGTGLQVGCGIKRQFYNLPARRRIAPDAHSLPRNGLWALAGVQGPRRDFRAFPCVSGEEQPAPRSGAPGAEPGVTAMTGRG